MSLIHYTKGTSYFVTIDFLFFYFFSFSLLIGLFFTFPSQYFFLYRSLNIFRFWGWFPIFHLIFILSNYFFSIPNFSSLWILPYSIFSFHYLVFFFIFSFNVSLTTTFFNLYWFFFLWLLRCFTLSSFFWFLISFLDL